MSIKDLKAENEVLLFSTYLTPHILLRVNTEVYSTKSYLLYKNLYVQREEISIIPLKKKKKSKKTEQKNPTKLNVFIRLDNLRVLTKVNSTE